MRLQTVNNRGRVAVLTGKEQCHALPENRHDNSGVARFTEEKPRQSVHAAVNFERARKQSQRPALT